MVVLYLVFCLTTAIMSLFKHFFPNLKKMRDNGVNNEVSKNRVLSSCTYFCLATIFAPVVILAVFGVETSQTYSDRMYDSLVEEIKLD